MNCLVARINMSENTFNKIAKDVVDYILNSPYNELRGTPRSYPVYYKHRLYIETETSTEEDILPNTDYNENIINILSRYVDEYAMFNSNFHMGEYWTGTDTENGYFDEYNIIEGKIVRGRRFSIPCHAADDGKYSYQVLSSGFMEFYPDSGKYWVKPVPWDTGVKKFRDIYYMRKRGLNFLPKVKRYDIRTIDKDDFKNLACDFGYENFNIHTTSHDTIEEIFAKYLKLPTENVKYMQDGGYGEFNNTIMFSIKRKRN